VLLGRAVEEHGVTDLAKEFSERVLRIGEDVIDETRRAG
jgi:hypothetical protein